MNNFDYNLLRVLEVLLEEQSVTAAAARLHLSQSAVSKQLAKLRETFSDPLFERTAHGLRATPRAKALAPQLRLLLQQLEQFTRPSEFDPALSHREFRIDMVEAAYSLTYPCFMPELLAQAPNIRLSSQIWGQDSIDKLLRCDIDMAICIREWDERSPLHFSQIPPELNYVALVRDHPICIMRADHPLLDEPWGLDTFLKYRHLQVSFGGVEHWLLDDVLAREKRQRDIAVNMAEFHSALRLCESSDLIMSAPAKYAATMMGGFQVRSLEVPVDLVPGAYVLMWHQHYDLDPSHRWLRSLMIDQVKARYPAPPAGDASSG